eukprot:scaffold350210_cov34-Prasinocladus_malaysianus.AAC.2
MSSFLFFAAACMYGGSDNVVGIVDVVVLIHQLDLSFFVATVGAISVVGVSCAEVPSRCCCGIRAASSSNPHHKAVINIHAAAAVVAVIVAAAVAVLFSLLLPSLLWYNNYIFHLRCRLCCRQFLALSSQVGVVVASGNLLSWAPHHHSMFALLWHQGLCWAGRRWPEWRRDEAERAEEGAADVPGRRFQHTGGHLHRRGRAGHSGRRPDHLLRRGRLPDPQHPAYGKDRSTQGGPGGVYTRGGQGGTRLQQKPGGKASHGADVNGLWSPFNRSVPTCLQDYMSGLLLLRPMTTT